MEVSIVMCCCKLTVLDGAVIFVISESLLDNVAVWSCTARAGLPSTGLRFSLNIIGNTTRASGGSDGKGESCNAGDSAVPGVRKIPLNLRILQYSCLEIPMDKQRAWRLWCCPFPPPRWCFKRGHVLQMILTPDVVTSPKVLHR